MATKVDRTASMLCRAHGCSSESLARRVMHLETALADARRRLADAARAANTGIDRADAALEESHDAKKGTDLESK